MATINREMDITENDLIQAIYEVLEAQGERGATMIEIVASVGWPVTQHYIRKMRTVLNGMDSDRIIRCRVHRTYNVGGEVLVKGYRLG